MGIEVFWKDSDGRELGQVFDSEGHFFNAVCLAAQQRRDDQRLLRTINPYDDTLIMVPQTETLARELEIARSETVDVEARIHLGNVIALARQAGSVSGSYLECVGD